MKTWRVSTFHSRQPCSLGGIQRLGRRQWPRQRLFRHCIRAGVESKLLEVFTAVSEGRLSPVDAAQTVEESMFWKQASRESVLPKIVNGKGKRIEWIGREVQALFQEQGHVLVTDITPANYAELRKIVPGVVYHAGAKTLKMESTGAVRKLPGSVAIISDPSVESSVSEELQMLTEYLGCYTFQSRPFTVTQIAEIVHHLQKISHASVLIALYDEETALPDVIAACTDVPVVSVNVGAERLYDIPSGVLTAKNTIQGAYAVARILNSVSRLHSEQERAQITAATIDEQIQDALEILNNETQSVSMRHENNVVSSEVHETASINAASSP